MPDPSTYDYAVIRVVPRVEREEFVNVGVLVSCPGSSLLVAGTSPRQIIVSGTAQQRAEAAEILAETRRRLYGLLAEGDPE